MSVTLSVHRCRFVDYTPAAITAIAFPPQPLPSATGKGKRAASLTPNLGTLAVGRTNGNIELHEWTGVDQQTQASQGWVLKKILPGPVPSKIDGLVFALREHGFDSSDRSLLSKHLRLFSTGGGSEILEWNLDTGAILRSVSSQAGSVWSIAANPSSSLLALGCEDGSVRILSLADDTLTHYRRLDRVKARLLSIAWGPPVLQTASHSRVQSRSDVSSEDEDETGRWTDSWLVAGCSDSSLRKFDIVSGRVVDKMSTDKSRGERTLVWAVGVLGDGSIVSGDSLGTVKFWDSTTCTQLQTFQAHGADVLCLTVGPEGKSVYTSGVDQKVCQFSNVQVSTASTKAVSASSGSRWVHACSRRLHSHDVRAIATWPPYVPLARSLVQASTIAPILVSGGLDMSLVICPCYLPSAASTSSKILNPLGTGHFTTFEDAYHHRVPYSTGASPAIQLAREARLILCRRDTGLALWKIRRSVSPGDVGLVDLENLEHERGEDWEKMADMELKVRTNLVASAISSNGRWVAASDLYETKLFQLSHVNDEIRPKRVKLSTDSDMPVAGATSLLFTADSSKLILGTCMGASLVVIIDLAGTVLRVLRSFEHHRMQNIIVGGSLGRAAKDLPASDDLDEEMADASDHEEAGVKRSSVVTSTITCLAASLDGQWMASADTRHRIHVFNLDSVQHHCALPSFPHATTVLTFDPAAPSMLVIGLANNTLQVFDVERRQFPMGSLSEGGWSRFGHLHDPLLGIAFDPHPSSKGEEGHRNDGSRHALLWASTWMCKVNVAGGPVGLGTPLPTSKKRRRESKKLSGRVQAGLEPAPAPERDDEERNVRPVTRYRPVLYVDFVGPGELVVVERSLVDVLSTLPPAYFKPSYGS